MLEERALASVLTAAVSVSRLQLFHEMKEIWFFCDKFMEVTKSR